MVIDNYRPGVLKRLGMDYETLSKVNPRIITMSITGFGESGLLAEKPSFDPIFQALSGLMSAQGASSDPVFLSFALNDVTAASLSALGVCIGLLHRERHGPGQRMWTTLAGCSAFMQAGELVRFAGRTAHPWAVATTRVRRRSTASTPSRTAGCGSKLRTSLA